MSDFDFTDELNIGKEYNGFILVKIDDIPEEKCKAVFLRHKTTGLEVYHMLKDDKENLFSFTFRTPVTDSKGKPHIIEHSTLCGSERFPLKEPFNTLDNRSVKTFLNAYTMPDRTSYPASSLVKSDYFNLFDVYADAVFFPKLSRETFAQEGHRLELDKNGKLSIQGVVYNEMKGAYSSFENEVANAVICSMYPDSVYSYESGGEPLEIPTLTYEEFVDFHAKYYIPSNCLVFLWGNIPTSVQLDFLNEKYISRLENKFGVIKSDNINSSLPLLSQEMQTLLSTERITESITTNSIGPDNGEQGSAVGIIWYSDASKMEKIFLSDLLYGNDSSPMSCKLKESNLGEDLSSLCGSFPINAREGLYGFGLSGVQEKDVEKVQQLILDSINEIYEQGVSEEDIASAVMGIDFFLHEITRFSGPRSINILSKVSGCWELGYGLTRDLSPITDFEKIKKSIKEDPSYVKNLIKKNFIDNKIINKICVTPSKEYFKKRNKIEADLIKKLEKTVDKNQLKIDLDNLHAYQQKVETEEELSCIPHLKISELPVDLNYPELKVTSINIKNPENSEEKVNIPVLLNEEETNGVVYLELLYPADNLSPEDLKDFPLMRSIVGELGWNNKDWKVCTNELCSIMGDLIPLQMLGASGGYEINEQEYDRFPDRNMAERYWLRLSSRFLTTHIKESLNLLIEAVPNMDFKDVEHFETLLKEYKNHIKTDFVGSENSYLSYRASSKKSIPCAMQELMYGITQFFHTDNYKIKNSKKLLKKLESMYYGILSQGAIIHITADSDSMKKLLPEIPSFAEALKIKPLQPKLPYTLEDYFAQVYSHDNYSSENKLEVFKLHTNSGCAMSVFEGSGCYTRESEAERVLSYWLNSHQLWEKIRMTGGAYGGGCTVNPIRRTFSMKTWRDPTPEKSLEVFGQSLKELSEIKLSEENVECTIISSYSDEICLDSPRGRGDMSLGLYLYGRTPERLKEDIKNRLSITPEDVQQAAIRLYKNWMENHRDYVCCDNSVEICGNIINIPL